MTVTIWRTGSGYSFSPLRGSAESLLIQAPSGSEVLPTQLLGPLLFVPGPGRVRLGHAAEEVVRAASERRGAFRFV